MEIYQELSQFDSDYGFLCVLLFVFFFVCRFAEATLSVGANPS